MIELNNENNENGKRMIFYIDLIEMGLFEIIKNGSVKDLIAYKNMFPNITSFKSYILSIKNKENENCITFAAKLERHDMIKILIKYGQKIKNIEIKDCRRNARRVYKEELEIYNRYQSGSNIMTFR
ncbi:hypothetical protein EDEG_00411 [Edhazardia aedis USNM 41457]|uniref:Ankyrin repeat protein n=1 Tax=Edhazardia aedis (strain USNM 41457) TaxID=1003232 RepID=J9D1W5_EDHAE|nr:hypothetical protein EDEG_00411 [Edhazardia aedis USNM 41457]|eukprot:EJW01559.1 hypothetical protein EDEG_00411 [Edhazardia aedis USNM 41457]